MQGGGFIYTNRDSISLGLVVNAADLQRQKVSISQLLEDFKAHPSVAPLIADGEVAEYSAHLVPEAGINMQPSLFSDGILVAGDAAGFVINLGCLVRGMDLAITSGEAAAQAILAANSEGDFSRSSLSRYPELLKQNGTLTHMEAYRQTPKFLETRRIYEQYPGLVASLAYDVFTVDGRNPEHLMTKIMHSIKSSQTGYVQLVRDAWKGGRSL